MQQTVSNSISQAVRSNTCEIDLRGRKIFWDTTSNTFLDSKVKKTIQNQKAIILDSGSEDGVRQISRDNRIIRSHYQP